jgi:hypothetical protein
LTSFHIMGQKSLLVQAKRFIVKSLSSFQMMQDLAYNRQRGGRFNLENPTIWMSNSKKIQICGRVRGIGMRLPEKREISAASR